MGGSQGKSNQGCFVQYRSYPLSHFCMELPSFELEPSTNCCYKVSHAPLSEI